MTEHEFQDFRRIFIERLKEFIGEQSILSFSRSIDIPERTINGWMRGTSLPRIESLIDLAKKLDCSIDYLVGISDQY